VNVKVKSRQSQAAQKVCCLCLRVDSITTIHPKNVEPKYKSSETHSFESRCVSAYCIVQHVFPYGKILRAEMHELWCSGL